MAGVFISYRRQDSAGWAGRLATDLLDRFGAEAVFQDINAIRAGEDFVTVIDRALGSCSALIVLIGPDWSTIKGKDGTLRLDDPSDTVRLELSKALQRKAIRVIPVLLGGAKMPEADDLPSELKPLARRNAIELSDKRWDYDFDQLAECLAETAGLTPVEKSVRPVGARTKMVRLFSVLGIILTLAIAVLLYFRANPPSPESAFKVFSIEKPVNDQEIPLGENQTRMLEGEIQLADWQHAPSIDVEVIRLLPERLPVPQDGKVRISTESGRWRFESARFSGEGSYEILATISINGRSDWRSVMVKCIPKGAAFQRVIEKDRKIRGVSAVDAVKLSPTQLPELKSKLMKLQQEFFVLFPDNLDGAEANVTRTLDLLDPVLPMHPNDWQLQNLRAYTFKNYAMVMRNRGKAEEFGRALGEAERMFETIREQKPDDPGAWNGLGSVALLRREPERALVYIDRALEILPNYGAAKHDRKLAVKMLNQKKKTNANPDP